jgi:hypothetical protein
MDEPQLPKDSADWAAQSEQEEGGDWADEAARARTTDDPRIITPHDSAGVPSTENESSEV